jgi:myo-inositol catabolism protein IolC
VASEVGYDHPNHDKRPKLMLELLARPRRERVACIALGAGAGGDLVERQLRPTAATPGYVGFAVSRTLWWHEVRGFLVGVLGA